MLRRLAKNERGGVIVLFAVALAVLAGLSGMVVDVGYLYVRHAQLQNGVDAACLAGAVKLPSAAEATAAAEQYAALNNMTNGELVSTFPANNYIRVTYTEAFDTFFMNLFGFDKATIQVVAAAILPPTTPGDPTVLALKQNGNIILVINGSNNNIDGRVHSNSQFRLNGWLTINGDATSSGDFLANSFGTNVTVNGASSEDVAVVEVPDYSDAINATPAYSYSSSQRFNGNGITIDGTVSVNGNLDINGNNFTCDGSLLATGDIHNNGNAITTTGDATIIYSSNGDIHINGNDIAIDATLFAPNGEVIINGNNITINGRVIGNTVTINGSGITINSPSSSGSGLSSVPQLVE